MDMNSIKKEISIINEVINEEIEMIFENKGKIPRIELDMLMSNLQKLYEYFYKLQKINEELLIKPEAKNTTSNETDTPEIKEKPKLKDKEVEAKIEDSTPITKDVPKAKQTQDVEETPIIEEKDKPEIADTEIVDKVQKEVKKFSEAKTENKPEKSKKAQREKSTLDLFGESSNTIGDKLRDKKDNSIAASMSHNKISSVKKAIGINEKFLFINELFNGNMQEYNQVLDKLDSMKNMTEAASYIDVLKSKHKWDTEKNPFIQFMDVIKRKYSV